jgi:hypothetical protein
MTIRIQDPDPNPDPNPDPDPLVRGMDPRIRIRIHPKMSWIRNTGAQPAPPHQLLGPVPGEPLLRAICIINFMVGSVFRIPKSQRIVSPDRDSAIGFPEYRSNLNLDFDPDQGHLSVL